MLKAETARDKADVETREGEVAHIPHASVQGEVAHGTVTDEAGRSTCSPGPYGWNRG